MLKRNFEIRAYEFLIFFFQFKQNIVATIEGSWHTMLEQLLAQLRTDLQLPKCLQIVGYLRRMQAFSFPELKLKFLQARDSWFCSILNSIPKDDREFNFELPILIFHFRFSLKI